MPDMLQCPDRSTSSYSEGCARQYKTWENGPVSLDNEKDLYLQAVYLSSADNVQDNWPRVVRREIETLRQALAEANEEIRRKSKEGHEPLGPESLLRRAARLDKIGQTDSALDLLYDAVDTILNKGRLDELDSMLERAEVESLSVDLLLALLTATLPARHRLPYRNEFLKRVHNSLDARGQYEDGLLAGL